MTQAEAVALARSAINQRITTVYGYTNPYGAQCVAFTAWYLAQLGYTQRVMPGYNAIDIYTSNPVGLPKFATPQVGDVFFMNYYSGGVNWGHTGVVTVVGNGTFSGVSQNYRAGNLDVGGAASEDNYQLSRMAGFLRPNFSGGDEMIPDQDNYYWRWGQKAAMQIQGRELSRAEFQKWMVGQNGTRALEVLSDDPAADRALEWQKIGKMATEDKWQQQIYTLQDQLAAANKRPSADQFKAIKEQTDQLAANMKSAQDEAAKAKAESVALQAKLADAEKYIAADKAQEAEAVSLWTKILNLFKRS